nr:hypothetical protein [Paenibacillus bovis]
MNNFDKKIVKSYLDENITFSNEDSEKILRKIHQGNNTPRKINLTYWTVLASAAIIFLVLGGAFLKDTLVGTENNHNVQGHNNSTLPVDLSDIESMNIGAEIPRLIYADHNIAVMQGTFGVIVYNTQDSKVTNRISYEHIKPYGISMMLASVSEDGSTIYIGNDDMSNEFKYTHQYDINTRVIKETTQQPTRLFSSTNIETPGYNEKYDKYFDLNYLTGNTIVEFERSFMYVRSSDWEMKNLQIVLHHYENGESKIFDVFK